MARKNTNKPRTAWGKILYDTRMLTRTPSSRYVGHWPLSRELFVAWINQNLPAGAKPICLRAYVAWEYGAANPQKRNKTAVKLVLDNCKLPGV